MVDLVSRARSYPKHIQVDNGTPFISKALDKWVYDHGVELDFSPSGNRRDNPCAESFSGIFRDERPNVNWFFSLKDVQEEIERWRQEYEDRTHTFFGDIMPREYPRKHSEAEISRCGWSEIGEHLKVRWKLYFGIVALRGRLAMPRNSCPFRYKIMHSNADTRG